MPNYDLNRLGDKEFERLCQSLLKEIIGNGTTTFGEGPDGGREATFKGRAPYPSLQQSWSGEWIFQVKYHDIQRIGPDDARKLVIKDLRSELDKVVNKFQRNCNNYILITNVPLSSVHIKGTHDQIMLEVVPDFSDKIANIHVWGYDEVCRFLEKYINVRKTYLSFITPGDIIAEIMEYKGEKSRKSVQIIHAYMTTAFRRERYAQLDQAGQTENKKMELKDVFIDLNARFLYEKDQKYFHMRNSVTIEDDVFSATNMLLSETSNKVVLIGGPGEGKSTIGQYLAQIHRATLLGRRKELTDNKLDVTPLIARIPFKVVLKDYAQWLDEAGKKNGLEFYLSEHLQELASAAISSDSIQEIFQKDPCLLIFDGLDEITEPDLQGKVLDRISEFLDRCEHVLQADIQVLATSRPTSYSNQFDFDKFTHIRLVKLSEAKVLEYINNWTQTKEIDRMKTRRLKQTIKECLSDPQISLLMNTPLQVTILILIVLSGGTPPRQREALFNEYLEVIYKRESAKATIKSNKQELFELHEYLGYVLHKRASKAQEVRSSLDRKEFSKEVKNFFKSNDPYTSKEELEKKVERIVKEAEERLVLIVELEKNLFGFELRSIQEFFAAAHLANAPKEDIRYARFEAIAKHTHWRNVALFFAGRIGRLHSAEAANIISACRHIDIEKPDQFLRRGAQLSLELAADHSFGHKRRFQWDVIEYGLTLLQYDIPYKNLQYITETLDKLSNNDIQDLVIPILKQKLAYANLGLTDKILDVCQKIHVSKDFISEILNDFFNILQEETIELAFKKSIEFDLNADWINSRLKRCISHFPIKSLARSLISAIYSKTRYIQICLENIIIDQSDIIMLTDHILSMGRVHRYSSYEDILNSMPKFTFPNFSSMEEQMYFTFYCVLKITEAKLNEDKNEYDFLADMPPNFTEQVQLLLNKKDLLPHLAAIFWIVILSRSPLSKDQLEDFKSFYISNKKYKGVTFLLNTISNNINPLFPILLYYLEKENVKEAYSILNSIKFFSEKKDFMRSKNKLLEKQDVNIKSKFLSILIFGSIAIENAQDKKDFEDTFENLFGLNSYYIPEILSLGLIEVEPLFVRNSRIRRQNPEFIMSVIKDIANNLDYDFANGLRRLNSLRQLDWPLDERLQQKAQSLLIQVLAKADEKNSSNKLPIISFFCKLYESGTPSAEFASLFFERLAQSNTTLHLPLSRHMAKNILANLLNYLENKDMEQQRGISILILAIIDVIYRLPPKEIAKEEYFAEEYKIDINIHVMHRLLYSENSLLRDLGINLINFATHNPHNIPLDLQDRIINCSDTIEAKSWSRVIRYLNIGKNEETWEKWKYFLEHVLEKKSKVFPVIYQASTRRYERLVVSQEYRRDFDEEKLGLPFNQE